MHRLSRAGYKAEFVRLAILPEWWSDECAADESFLPEVEIRVARFLGLPLEVVRDPGGTLVLPGYPGAHLRRVRDLDLDRLAPAIHAGLRIAGAVVHSLGESVPEPTPLPREGLVWREQVRRQRGAVALDGVLDDLWLRGVPVVGVELLPSPSFQGMACVVEGRPVILVGHKHDEPSRVAFVVAHEAGHVAAGDCKTGQPVVDEETEILDAGEMERRADRFATQVLIGSDETPRVDATNFKELATRAAQIERATGADATAVIFAWAAETRDYAMATRAVKALYRAEGGRRKLEEYFDRYVDLESATECDRALLRCVRGGLEHNETDP